MDVAFIADPDGGLPLGTSLNTYDGFIWTGSDLTIYKGEDPRVIRQIELAKAIYDVGVPSYGSCWGIQMAAVAAGGEVQKNPNGRDWGIARDIHRTQEGRGSSFLSGKPDRFDGFIMHLDEVTRLPAGATLLASNAHTRVQALEVRHGKGVYWATQNHPEFNLLEMARLISARAEALVNEGFFDDTDSVESYTDDMRSLYHEPGSNELRKKLSIREDILFVDIRECELRNWIDHLVLPLKK